MLITNPQDRGDPGHINPHSESIPLRSGPFDFARRTYGTSAHGLVSSMEDTQSDRGRRRTTGFGDRRWPRTSLRNYAWLLGIREDTIVDLPVSTLSSSYFLMRTLGPDNVCLYGEESSRHNIKILPPNIIFLGSAIKRSYTEC